MYIQLYTLYTCMYILILTFSFNCTVWLFVRKICIICQENEDTDKENLPEEVFKTTNGGHYSSNAPLPATLSPPELSQPLHDRRTGTLWHCVCVWQRVNINFVTPRHVVLFRYHLFRLSYLDILLDIRLVISQSQII